MGKDTERLSEKLKTEMAELAQFVLDRNGAMLRKILNAYSTDEAVARVVPIVGITEQHMENLRQSAHQPADKAAEEIFSQMLGTGNWSRDIIPLRERLNKKCSRKTMLGLMIVLEPRPNMSIQRYESPVPAVAGEPRHSFQLNYNDRRFLRSLGIAQE